MKILTRLACGLAVVVLGGCAMTRTGVHSVWLEQSSHRIAVLPLSGDETFGEELADALVTQLVEDRFSVMERTQLKQIMKEQTFQCTGAADPFTLARTGRLNGVDFIVMGSVTTRRVTPALEWFLGDGESHDQIDVVQVRWVSVQSGQIMASTTLRNARGGKMEDVAKKIVQSLRQGIQVAAAQEPHNKDLPRIVDRELFVALK